jgi:DNA-binding MltR family transcriptional regulator
MSKRLNRTAPQWSEFLSAYSAFHKQKDRGTVLMAAAWLDDLLGELLRRSFRADPGSVDSLLRPDRALGAFASRITLAYLVGLLTPSMREDLEIVRSIRNDFAHTRGHVTFSSPSVRDRCRNLISARIFNQFSAFDFRSPRDLFTVTCLILSNVLSSLPGTSSLPPQGIGDGSYEILVKNWAESISKQQILETIGKAP